ncbi:lipoyl(octanoyl) transferase LipB [Buchnera aphidicola (Chaitoregma tattakana)]|uniref:lipoyl(octanoyl) transferase LipB n=1 Tax=Buchnera aphidicola TaxID=9 RepID=UPI0031B89EA7
MFKDLGIKDWKYTYTLMKNFVQKKRFQNEIWFTEHLPVFILGKKNNNKKIYYITQKINIYNSNRGGGITYHGPGQQLVYFLIYLKKIKKMFYLIKLIKRSVISTLNYFNITSYYIPHRPGIYVNKKKICSIGLCFKNGYSMHGLSLNVDMDLFPFNLIVPCENYGVKMTNIKLFNKFILIEDVKKILKKKINFFYNKFFINNNS